VSTSVSIAFDGQVISGVCASSEIPLVEELIERYEEGAPLILPFQDGRTVAIPDGKAVITFKEVPNV